MHRIKQTAIFSRSRWYSILKSQKCGTDLGLADLSSNLMDKAAVDNGAVYIARKLQGVSKSGSVRQYFTDSNHMTMDMHRANGVSVLIGKWIRECRPNILPPLQITGKYGPSSQLFRHFSSSASDRRGKNQSENKKDISTIEDPFDSPTYNIPEKPVTFAEGASYSLVILAGLGVAAVAAYAVFKELIFEPKEYKIFGKALERVKNDGQVKVRIGTPITGYGQESRNRAARQRIPNRTWTDENGIEHIEINFHIRGPRGAGIVYAVMYKDKADKQWKYTSLIVQIKSPSPAQLILESYIPT